MTAQTVATRLQWIHLQVVQEQGVTNTDAIEYATSNNNNNNTNTNTTGNDTNINGNINVNDEILKNKNNVLNENAILEMQRQAIQSIDDTVIGKPPFHLRNGDCIVWTDISIQPNEKQKKKEI